MPFGYFSTILPSTRTLVLVMVSVPAVNEISDHLRPSTSARRRPSSESSQHANRRSAAAAVMNCRIWPSLHVPCSFASDRARLTQRTGLTATFPSFSASA